MTSSSDKLHSAFTKFRALLGVFLSTNSRGRLVLIRRVTTPLRTRNVRSAPPAPSGKVVWVVTMSLDGFVTGPQDSMEWVFDSPETNPAIEEVIRTTGAVLSGRLSYDAGQHAGHSELREVFGGGWKGPQFVMTHPSNKPSANGLLNGDLLGAVATALAAADGRNVNIIGTHLARECIAAGLIDEIVAFIAPILLGDGVRVFDTPGGPPIVMEPVGLVRAGRVAMLRLRVVSPR